MECCEQLMFDYGIQNNGEVIEYETGDEKLYKFQPLFGNTLRFSVKAAHDCHLAFTTGAAETEPMFEIFIAAWEGTASAIRFNKGDDLAKEETPEILSDGEFREFWVTRTDNQVTVGKGGDSSPFLSAELPEPVPATHFGYSTGYGATGTFQFFSEAPIHQTGDEKQYRFRPFFGKTLRFMVKAAHDCHLAFTSADSETDPMFEVFISAWEGDYSAIRFRKGEEEPDDLVKVGSTGYLDEAEFREFWVATDHDEVRVGKGGEFEPFMSCALPEPVVTSHFGFSTGYGATGSFIFFHERQVPTPDKLQYNFEPMYGDTVTFNVACDHDAHVSFTTAAQETPLMYEIFIGGWENQHSAIRKSKETTVAKVDTPDECCGGEKTYWINIRGGDIRVGRAGEADHFMQWQDPEPFKVTHVGYCTGWGACGQWKLNV
ncbi:Farnesoic acid O-methyl transferase [Trinorchestia longiramus]|nr:Farnesoic acid O-methyl transferase [Trinorchestia longiramus]